MFDPSTFPLIALKTSLLIGVIGTVSVALARKSAAYRHFLWTSALALTLLMPFAMLYVPSFALIPVPWHSSDALPNALARMVEEGLGAEGLSRILAPAMLIIWFIGALGLLIREFLANIGLIRWMRRAQPVRSLRWTATLDRVSNELGAGRPLRVLESAQVAGPCTWGFVQPVLLLPAAGADWTESQRRHALLHELAHVRRFDCLSTLVARLACALHWYNPLVWFAAAQARKLQEQACDDAVLRGGGTPSEYAQFLLGISEESNRALSPLRIALGMTQRSPLYARVVAILDPRRPRMQPGRLVALVALLPMLGLMLLLATTVMTTAADAPQPPQPISAVPAVPVVPAIPAIPAIPAEERVTVDPPTPAESAT